MRVACYLLFEVCCLLFAVCGALFVVGGVCLLFVMCLLCVVSFVGYCLSCKGCALDVVFWS